MNILTEENAKGCPFCGGVCTVEEIETGCWGVGCEDCDYQVMSGPVGIGWFRSEHDAVKTWNDRNSDFALEFANGALKNSTASLADAQAEIARLRAALERAVSFVQHAEVSSGVCCCGDSIEGHGSPMNCGHLPRDMWDYAAEGFIKETRALLDTK